MRQAVRIANTTVPLTAVAAHGPMRLVTLVATDVGALVLSGGAAQALWRLASSEPGFWRPWQVVALVPLFSLGYAFAGLYPGFGVNAIQMIRTTVRQTSLVFLVIVSSGPVVHLHETHGRGVLGLWWLLALVAVPLARARLSWWTASWSWWREPVLLVGDGPRIEALVETLARSRHIGYRPSAICLTGGPLPLTAALDALPVVAATDVASAAHQLRIGTVLLALPDGEAREWARAIGDRVERVITMLSVEDGYVEPVAIRHLGTAVGIETQNRLLIRRNKAAKRIADVVLASTGLVLALPVMAVAALAIVLCDRGPFLHRQYREGRGGRRFRMYKLRTMYRDAEERLLEHLHADPAAREEWEREFKLTSDPRVLPRVGTFLRRWSLDECPQLWNVLKGEMSLVGPRALPAYHLDAFAPGFRTRRQQVRPGVTGLWQVLSRGRGAIRQQEALDGYYISNWSIWMDIFILAKTVEAVVSGRGAR